MKTAVRWRSAAAAGAVGILVLAGCSSTGNGDSGGGDDPYEIAFIQGTNADEFYISMKCGVEAAAEKAGAKASTTGPQQFDVTLQKPIVDSVIASNPDAILIAPNDVTALSAPLSAAAANGTKIVLVDTTVEDPSFAVSEISSDNEGGGAAAFDAIKKLHPEGGKVLVVNTAPGVSTTDARVKGFEEAVEGDSDFEYVGVQYGKNDPTQSAQVTTAALQKDPDIVGVFAINLLTSEGVATGVRQAGRDGEVSIVGFDAGPDQIKALEDGTVQALIAQQPNKIGELGVEQAIAALEGKSTEKKIGTGFTILTKDNLADESDAVYQSNCG